MEVVTIALNENENLGPSLGPQIRYGKLRRDNTTHGFLVPEREFSFTYVTFLLLLSFSAHNIVSWKLGDGWDMELLRWDM